MTPNSHKLFRKLEKEGTLPSVFYEALKLKSDKALQIKQNKNQEGTK